jgi:O-succinylbenzoic acid--CoA ligase
MKQYCSFWSDDTSQIFESSSSVLTLTARKLMLAEKETIWLSTSGTTTGIPDWFGILKSGYLKAAKSICDYFGVHCDDRWCLCLPIFHVGGLSILARSHVSGCSVDYFSESWNPQNAWDFMKENKSTIVSLVPTQLHDIVSRNLASPKSLRVAILGGAALDQQLYESALELGWPVISSYGLTEASALLAAQPMSDLGTKHRSALQLMRHIDARVSSEGNLELRGDSVVKFKLRQLNAEKCEITDPTNLGWFKTNDLVQIECIDGIQTLIFQDRADRNVKINGELVSLNIIEGKIRLYLKEIHQEQPLIHVGAVYDKRSGNKLILFIEGQTSKLELVALDRILSGLERISAIHLVRKFPRFESGKININDLNRLTSAELSDIKN